jgi:hypothetical protein
MSLQEKRTNFILHPETPSNMQRTFLLICLLFFIGDLNAQRAVLYTVQGDSSEVTLPMFEADNAYFLGKFQDGFAGMTAFGLTDTIYPGDVARVKVMKDEHAYTFVSAYVDGEMRFLQLVSDGMLRVMIYQEATNDGFIATRVLSIDAPNQSQYNTKVSASTFKKGMYKLFTDYPEMVEKVKNKQFKYVELEAMVEYFNLTYGAR